jgi:cytochrome c6
MAGHQIGGRGSRGLTWVRGLALAAGLAGSGLWQPAMAADPLQGRKLYKSHCENCHGANGAGQIPGAPDFLRGGALMKPDLELMRAVKAGRGMMPAYQGMFTEPELLDVIAYLRTLRLQR